MKKGNIQIIQIIRLNWKMLISIINIIFWICSQQFEILSENGSEEGKIDNNFSWLLHVNVNLWFY